jgi:hypothetical protein
MGGNFESQLWFSAIRDYTVHDYYGMTSNNEGQLSGALSSLRHIRHGNLSKLHLASSSPSSSYSLETEDGSLVSSSFSFLPF